MADGRSAVVRTVLVARTQIGSPPPKQCRSGRTMSSELTIGAAPRVRGMPQSIPHVRTSPDFKPSWGSPVWNGQGRSGKIRLDFAIRASPRSPFVLPALLDTCQLPAGGCGKRSTSPLDGFAFVSERH